MSTFKIYIDTILVPGLICLTNPHEVQIVNIIELKGTKGEALQTCEVELKANDLRSIYHLGASFYYFSDLCKNEEGYLKTFLEQMNLDSTMKFHDEVIYQDGKVIKKNREQRY